MWGVSIKGLTTGGNFGDTKRGMASVTAALALLRLPSDVSSRITNPTMLEVAHNALGVLLQHRHVVVGRFTHLALVLTGTRLPISCFKSALTRSSGLTCWL